MPRGRQSTCSEAGRGDRPDAEASMSVEIHYLFHGEPRAKTFEMAGGTCSPGSAARHLIELHFADAENSLAMPGPDDSDAQLLEHAEVFGISDIRISRS